MNNSLRNHLALVRDHYVNELLKSVAEANTASSADSCIPEPVLRDADGKAAVEGAFHLPYRADLYDANEGQTRMINSPGTLVLPENTVSLTEGSSLTLKPFVWDYATFIVAHPNSEFATQKLLDWFRKWFDEADEKPQLSNGLSGCVHYLSDPITVKSETRFTVDFGSAPTSAFSELVSALGSTSAYSITVSSQANNN